MTRPAYLTKVGGVESTAISTTYAMPVTADVPAGSTVLIIAQSSGGRHIASATDSQGNVYQQDKRSANTTGARVSLLSGVITTALTTSDVITLTQSAAGLFIADAFSYSGILSVALRTERNIESSGSGSGITTSGPITHASPTGIGGEQIAIGVIATNNNQASNPTATGYTLRPRQANDRVALFEKDIDPSDPLSITFNWTTGASAWAAVLVSYMAQVQSVSAPSSIPSGEGFGAPSLTPSGPTIAPAGISSLQAFGTPVIGRGTVSITKAGDIDDGGSQVGTPSVSPGVVTIRFLYPITGIDSGEAWGVASITPPISPVQTLSPTSIDSGESWGTHGIVIGSVALSPSGIATAESFGAAVVTPGAITLSSSGIASAENFGVATLSLGAITLQPTGIDDGGSQIGTPVVTAGVRTLLPTGIGSSEQHGTPILTLGTITLSPGGIGSAEAFGVASLTPGVILLSPPSIASSEAFGVSTVLAGARTLSPSGIATAEAFGVPVIGSGVVTLSPTGIASAESFGVLTVAPGLRTLSPSGVASVEAFGVPVLTPGTVTLLPTGIASAEVFGLANIAQAVMPPSIASGEAWGSPSIAPGVRTVYPFSITLSPNLLTVDQASAEAASLWNVGTRDSSISMHGQVSVRWDATGAVFYPTLTSFPVVEGGKPYTAEIWVYRDSSMSNVYFNFSWRNSAGSEISTGVSKSATLRNQWERVVITGVAPANAQWAMIYAGVPAGAGSAWVDEVGMYLDESKIGAPTIVPGPLTLSPRSIGTDSDSLVGSVGLAGTTTASGRVWTTTQVFQRSASGTKNTYNAGQAIALATYDSADVDLSVSARMRTGRNVGIMARYIDANNYVQAIMDSFGNNLILVAVVGGVVTAYTSVAYAFSNPDTLRLVSVGKRLTVYLNGVVKIDVDNVAVPNSTSHGIYANYSIDVELFNWSYLAMNAVGTPVVTPGQRTVMPNSITTDEAFGNAVITPGSLVITPSGISPAEVFGNATVTPGVRTLQPSGIASSESFGLAVVQPGQRILSPSGIATVEAFGIAVVQPGALIVSPTGIASGEAFGTLTVQRGAVTVMPVGIASAEAEGVPTITPGQVVVSPSGVASVEAFGTPTMSLGVVILSPTGIGSGQAFGSPVIAAGQITLLPTGIASAQAMGVPTIGRGVRVLSPTGIASGEQFGVPNLQAAISLAVQGIASQESWGVPTLIPLTVVSPAGIGSEEAFGEPILTFGTITLYPIGIESAEAFGPGILLSRGLAAIVWDLSDAFVEFAFESGDAGFPFKTGDAEFAFESGKAEFAFETGDIEFEFDTDEATFKE